MQTIAEQDDARDVRVTLLTAVRAAAVLGLGGVLAFGARPSVAAPPPGALTGLPGAGACVSPAAQPGCERLRGVWRDSLLRWVFAPDGATVYGVTESSPRHLGAVAVVARDPVTGRLHQLDGAAGCLSPLPGCTPIVLGGIQPRHLRLAVGPEGRSVTIVARRGAQAALLVFTRDPASGALQPLAGPRGCLASAPHTGCETVPLLLLERLGAGDSLTLNYPSFLTSDADGRSLSALSGGLPVDSTAQDGPFGALITLPRDPVDGGVSLTGLSCVVDLSPPPGCIGGLPAGESDDASRLLITPGGSSAYLWMSGVYAPDPGIIEPGSLVRFARDPTTGALSAPAGAFSCARVAGCAREPGGSWWQAPAFAADGSVAAVAGSVVTLYRLDADGRLAAVGCASADRVRSGERRCRSARELGVQDVAWTGTLRSPDGRFFYVGTGYGSDYPSSITAFRTDVRTGVVKQLPGSAGCFTPRRRHGCGRAPVTAPMMMTLSPDGQTLYVLALGAHRDDVVLNAFARNAATGALHRLRRPYSCVARHAGHGCRVVPGLGPTDRGYFPTPGIEGVMTTPDDRLLYTSVDRGLRGFARAPKRPR